jgi:hypothetical protein
MTEVGYMYDCSNNLKQGESMLQSIYIWTPHFTTIVPRVAVWKVRLAWYKRIWGIHRSTMWMVEACPQSPGELAVSVARAR